MITIVSGLPRSGTSMMMRILEAGGIPSLTDTVREADIDNPNGYYEFEPVKHTRETPSWLNLAEGKAVKMVYKLLYDLPMDREYRIIFMQRAFKEIIASQNKMLVRLGKEKQGSDRSEHELIGIFANEVAKCRKWLIEQPNIKVSFVIYNKILKDSLYTLTKLSKELPELKLDTSAMSNIVDPSLYRNRH